MQSESNEAFLQTRARRSFARDCTAEMSLIIWEEDDVCHPGVEKTSDSTST